MNAREIAVERFRHLHTQDCFVLPNPWNIGTAVYLQYLGFKALATTSAGFAFSHGRPDGGVSLEGMLTHIREVVTATSLPVTADFLNGFADSPDRVAENVARCVATGVAGLSVEDSTGRTDQPLYEKNLALERITAARRAIDDTGSGIVLTGRCESFLVRQESPLQIALDRLVAYAEAGADCLYAPGVTEPDEIAQIVKAVAPRPVNVLVAGFNAQLSLAQLADLGVRRISVGSGLALAAWGSFIRASREIAEEGDFTLLGDGAKSAELNPLFAARG
ncbi:MAG TPA: isocitrate lyase/phosphoenolpyruvate mutase family protein [Chthoniobacterales bacterium]